MKILLPAGNPVAMGETYDIGAVKSDTNMRPFLHYSKSVMLKFTTKYQLNKKNSEIVFKFKKKHIFLLNTFSLPAKLS